MTTRLNSSLRDRLKKEINSIVNLSKIECDKLSSMYHVTAPLVLNIVNLKYPLKDMLICKKYDAAFIDDCIKLQLTSGGVEMFHFYPDTGPLVAKKTYNNIIYIADNITTDSVASYSLYKKNFDEKLRALKNDYYALVEGSRTLEEVVEIWPEANIISQYARSQALTVLSQDVIQRIKNNIKLRNVDNRT